MIHGGEASARQGRRPAATGSVLVAAAVVSLVLSPITAVWALLVGPALVGAGLVLRPRRHAPVLVAIGEGIVAGVLPYFLLAVLQR